MSRPDGGHDGESADDEARAERRYLEQVRREVREERPAGRRRPDAGDPPAVELEGVSVRFGGKAVLSDVSFRVDVGETLCVLGGSGAGKSTVLRCILLLTRPDAGRIHVQGTDVTAAPLDEVLRVRRRLGMVFQASALFDSLPVFENVAFPLREHTERPENEIRDRVREVLTFVDLDPEEVADLLPAALSGGMKKRVAIARAIVGEPEILLFDEPTSGLDPITTRTINELVVKLRHELQVASVVVTHDIRSAFRISNRVALLYEGRIVFMGTPEEMIASEDEYVREFLR